MTIRRVAPSIKDFSHLTLPRLVTSFPHKGLMLNLTNTGTSSVNRVSIMWNYGKAGVGANSGYAASMVAPMLMQGCTGLNGNEIVEKIDYLGAFVGNRTSDFHTLFEAISLSSFTPQVLDVIKEILLNPTFPEDKFEGLKRRALASYELQWSRPSHIATEELFSKIAGHAHPYVKKTQREDVSAVTLENVKRAWEMGFNNTLLSVSCTGKLDEELIRQVEDFATSIRRATDTIIEPKITPYQPEGFGIHHVKRAGSPQTVIAIGIPTISRNDDDYIGLRITVMALGGYFGSRLVTSIREEKGLTYSISANLMGALEGSFIQITAACDPRYVEKVLELIKKEITRLSTETMDVEEFSRLRSYYLTTLASTMESFKTIGEYYDSYQTVGISPDYFNKQQEILESITPTQIKNLANKYLLPAEAITIIVGE